MLKSRETGVELHNHTGTVNDIHDISGGPLVSLSSFRLLIYYLNHWHSPPIYHLSPKLRMTLPLTIPNKNKNPNFLDHHLP